MGGFFFKLTKHGAVLLTIALLFASCDGLLPKKNNGSDVLPDVYQSEIDDYVRFEVAAMNMMIDAFEYFYKYSFTQEQFEKKWDQYVDYLDKFETEVLEQWKAGDNDIYTILKVIAESYSNPYYEVAQKVLKYHKKTSINLSDYEVISSDTDETIWEFTELITGIEFRFTWNEQLNQWNIEAIDNSVKKYCEEKTNKFVL